MRDPMKYLFIKKKKNKELEAEEWLDDFCRDERIHEVEEGKEDHNKSSGFEEESGLSFFMNTEGTKAEQSQHRQRPQRECEHRESTLPKIPCR